MKFHDVHDSAAGIFNTLSGTPIDLKYPHKGMIRIDDIIHSLSHICRFGGHSKAFYSVAQHSVLVSAIAPDHLKRAALLHDAAEAYLGDVIKPLKIKLGAVYGDLEIKFNAAICSRFELDPVEILYAIKPFDKTALEIEHECFIKQNPDPLFEKMLQAGLTVNPIAWSPDEARYEFNRAYCNLFDTDLRLIRWS